MNIILFGPPGAGKGTQSDRLAKKFNLQKVSTGELLRNEIKNNTSLGKKIRNLMDSGQLVSDNIINDLIIKILSNNNSKNRLIFDGYPRNLDQAKNFNSLLIKFDQKISCVLNLNVDKDIVVKRILGRQTCLNCGLIFNKFFNPATKSNHSCDPKFLDKRTDDNKKIIVDRYETYLNKTLPILDFYNQQNLLHKVNGMAKIDQIFEEICDIIASLEA